MTDREGATVNVELVHGDLREDESEGRSEGRSCMQGSTHGPLFGSEGRSCMQGSTHGPLFAHLARLLLAAHVLVVEGLRVECLDIGEHLMREAIRRAK